MRRELVVQEQAKQVHVREQIRLDSEGIKGRLAISEPLQSARVTFHDIAARTTDAKEDAQWDLVTTWD